MARNRTTARRRYVSGIVLAVAAAGLAAVPAAARQDFHCTDTAGAGLFWDADPAGPGRVAALAPESFTVSVVAPDRRLINKGAGGLREAVCRMPNWPKGNAGLVVCTDASGGETWLFNDAARTYTRSYLFGTPLATDFTDPNITVAHGACRPY
jgi:hypothetical protein